MVAATEAQLWRGVSCVTRAAVASGRGGGLGLYCLTLSGSKVDGRFVAQWWKEPESFLLPRSFGSSGQR